MTGEWESKLKRMAKGAMKRKEFMAQIKEFTREIVEKAKNFEGDSVSGHFTVLNVKCPKCGDGPFEEDYRTFKCRSCGLIIWKTMAGRLFDEREVETLLTEGKVGPLEGFRSKMGRKFNALCKTGRRIQTGIRLRRKRIERDDYDRSRQTRSARFMSDLPERPGLRARQLLCLRERSLSRERRAHSASAK